MFFEGLNREFSKCKERDEINASKGASNVRLKDGLVCREAQVMDQTGRTVFHICSPCNEYRNFSTL